LTAAAVLCSTLTTWAAYDGNPQAPAQITADNYGIYGFTEDNWSAFSGYYAISTAAELYGFAELVNGGTVSAKAVLTDNIEVNKNVLNDDGTLNGSPTYSWTPIGTSSKKYAGIFDGNSHTISGLYFNNTTDNNYPDGGNYVGLIGNAYNATIKNVGVINSYISGNSYVGGICGFYGNQTNCYNTGTVSGYSNVGGICGRQGTQTNCYNTGAVSASCCMVGGICGVTGTQTNCYNTGTVTGGQYVGGICGGNSTITHCYNIGTISGSRDVGGICGTLGTQTNCYYLEGCGSKNTLGVSTTAEEFASGKITYLLNGSTSEGNLAWYQTLVDGGDAYPVLDNTHAVVYTTEPCVTDNFSNTALEPKNHNWNSSGQCTVCGAYLSATLVTAENYSGLGLTADYVGYFAISTAEGLYSFAEFVNGGANAANAVLTTDIVVNENVLNDDGTLNGTPTYSWTPIGTNESQYQGTFDGNGHTISGLYFNNTTDGNYPDGGKYVGLIGVADGAEIKNVGVIGSYIRGYTSFGGICGVASNSNITNCYNTGTVSGHINTNAAGGICANGKTTTITNCYNTGKVTGRRNIGGICGVVGTQINCYYLEGSCSAGGGGVSATAEDFANGKVTWLLNGSTSGNDNVWRQTFGVGGDAYPVLDNTHGVVYATQPCLSFSNDASKTHKEHPSTDDVTGYCTDCGQYTVQATLVTESNYSSLNLTADFIDYYAISSAAQLYWFADLVNNSEPSANAVLTDNIEVNKNVLNDDGTLNGTPTYSWTPIGTNSKKYTGTFDGNGHTISGLYFDNTTDDNYPAGGNNVGLIGRADGAAIKNVGVIGSYIRGYKWVGGICGYNYNGTQTNCHNTGTVTGSYYYVGGICGEYGTQTNCYNTGTVSGSSRYVGGICGSDGTQTNCYNMGTVSSSSYYVGGICGYAGTQTDCYNTGTVSGSSGVVGGICGYNGTQTDCYNTGTVSSSSNYVGGICGHEGSQTNCYYLAGCAKDGNNVVQYGVGNEIRGKTTADVADKTTAATAEEFASGKIGYLLNGNNSTIWHQNLFADALPTLNDSRNVVMGYVEEDDAVITVYGNLVLTTNYEVAAGKTLSVPAGTTLTTTGNAVITNNGTIICNGTLAGNNLAGNGTFITNRLSLCSISNLSESYVYKGSAYTLEDGLSGVAVNTTIILGKTFTLDATISPSYTNNRNVGTATITWTNTADENDILSGQFEITPKDVELVWGDAEFIYNGAAQAPTATATGMVNGEELTVSVSGEQTNAGTYTATASISDNNYKLPEVVTKEFTIGKATPTYTAPENLSIKCNESLANITLPAGFAFENLNVELTEGDNTLTVKFTPEDTDNYKVVEGIEVKVVKAAHTAVPDAAVPATCTESGLTEGSHCSVCNEVLVAQEVIPAGHTVVTDDAIAATCTETGLTEGSHCSVCHEVLVAQKEIPAAGHKADSVAIENIVAATRTAAGSYDSVVYCSVCRVELSRTTVEVPQIVAETIKLASKPNKVEYKQGEALDVKGGKITIGYSDKSAEDYEILTGWVSDFNSEKVGKQTLTVTFEAVSTTLTTTFDVTVSAKDDDNTAVDEDAANMVNIYAYQNVIVVENATEEISVYNAMGALVCKDAARHASTADGLGARTEIRIDGTGVYIVKVGDVAKRVFINR